MKKKVILILLLALNLAACNTTGGKATESSAPLNENGSYEALVMIDGKVLSTIGELNMNNKYTPNEKIGTIEQKLDPETQPTKNFTSNYFEVGTEIYSTVEDPKVFLAKNQEGDYQIIE